MSRSKPVARAELGLLAGTAPLLAALLLSGCANGYGAPINGDQALSPEERRLQTVENRTVDLGRRVGALEQGQSAAAIGDQLRTLQGQVDQLRHDFDTSQQQRQQQYADLDARLKRIEATMPQAAVPAVDANGQPLPGASTAVPPPGGTPVVAAPAGTIPPPAYVAPVGQPPVVAAAPMVAAPAAAAPAPSSAAADEEAIYLKSFADLRAGKFDEAIRGFHSMLAKYPQGNYADNAWYWMGKCYFAKQDFPDALKSYQTVLQSYPASPKVPDALLETGIVFQTQQKNDQAKGAFQRLVQQYPSSTAAGQARTRLSQLQ